MAHAARVILLLLPLLCQLCNEPFKLSNSKLLMSLRNVSIVKRLIFHVATKYLQMTATAIQNANSRFVNMSSNRKAHLSCPCVTELKSRESGSFETRQHERCWKVNFNSAKIELTAAMYPVVDCTAFRVNACSKIPPSRKRSPHLLDSNTSVCRVCYSRRTRSSGRSRRKSANIDETRG